MMKDINKDWNKREVNFRTETLGAFPLGLSVHVSTEGPSPGAFKGGQTSPCHGVGTQIGPEKLPGGAWGCDAERKPQKKGVKKGIIQ